MKKPNRSWRWLRNRRRHRGLSTLKALGLVAAGVIGGLVLARLLRRPRGGAHRHLPPPHTVPFVDLPRYMGDWYEIASFPRRFQRGCVGTTATYTLREDGTVNVVNRCREGSLQGPERVAQGHARVVDPLTNARLKVRFFWPFRGDYWIVELAPDYSWAAVATPDRESLWILSRTPTMADETFAGIVTRLVRQGFEIGLLNRTIQSATSAAPMRGF
jgi:apolipoprotein D and lipocalin family protein